MSTEALAGTGPVLDYKRLDHSTFALRFGLIGLTWLGLVWASLASASLAAVPALVGAVLLPIWGLFWGGRGVRKARDVAAKVKGTQLLGDDHWLTQETERLCGRLGLPVRPWVATMPVMNAYAIGARPDHALVVIGTPLLDVMTREQVSAIIGHELGHIANNDMRRMALCEHFQRSLTWYVGWSDTLQGFARWALSWVTELWVLGKSRKREYIADAIGAALTSREAMKGALVTLHETPAPLSSYEKRNARLMARGKGVAMFSTHPTLQQRLHALDTASHLNRLPYLNGAPATPPALPAPARAEVLPDVKDVAYAKPDAGAAVHSPKATLKRRIEPRF